MSKRTSNVAPISLGPISNAELQARVDRIEQFVEDHVALFRTDPACSSSTVTKRPR